MENDEKDIFFVFVAVGIKNKENLFIENFLLVPNDPGSTLVYVFTLSEFILLILIVSILIPQKIFFVL